MKKFVIFLLIFIFTVSFAFADSLLKFLTIPRYYNDVVEFYDTENLTKIGDSLDITKDTENPTGEPNSATLSPDGNYIYVSNRGVGNEEYGCIWVLNSNREHISTIELGNEIEPSGIVFDTSDNSLIVGSTNGLHIVKLKDNLYERDTNVEIVSLFTKVSGPQIEPYSIWNCALYDSKIYTVENGGTHLFVYDKKTGDSRIIDLSEINFTLQDGSTYNINTRYVVNISPDGRWLLVCNRALFEDYESTVPLYCALVDLETLSLTENTPLPTVYLLNRDAIYGDFSKDNKYIYYTSFKDYRYLFKCSIDDVVKDRVRKLV